MRILALLLCCSALLADTVVLSDRSVLEGEVKKLEKDLEVGGERFPLGSVLLWEDGAGVVQLDTPFADQLEAYRVLADRKTLALCLERMEKAAAAEAGDAARALLDRAEGVGLEPTRAEQWAEKLAALPAGQGDFPVPGPEVRADLLLARAVANGASDWNERGLGFLRAALQADENHAGAKKLLDSVAYSKWRIGDERVWLDWKVDVLPDDVRVLPRRNHPDIARARVVWDRDIHGVESDEIVFITKMMESAPIRMCLRYARLTCKALDKMFYTPEPRHTENLPLVIYFYPNRDEYLQNASGGNPEGAKFLAATLGFYVPTENVSRFFWPNLPDPEQSVRDTFVHELTHHWIQRRCPRWHPRDVSEDNSRYTIPGYWLVEGFATFIQEGLYDIETGKWTHFNPHARCIDVTAALAKDGKLIDWDKVYPLKHSEFRSDLDATKPCASFRTKWSIREQQIWEIRLFYEQSGATCFFLYWGENGKYREQLLDYVTNYYTAQADKTTIEKGFGMTPQELGKKVEKWCIDVIDNGWRPR